MTIKNGKWISHLRKVNISAIEEHNGVIMAVGDGGLWKSPKNGGGNTQKP